MCLECVELWKNCVNIVITSSPRQGKTEAAIRLSCLLKEHGFHVGGIVCEGRNLRDLTTNESIQFLYSRREVDEMDLGETVSVGRHFIPLSAFECGKNAIIRAARSNSIVFIDEYGLLETNSSGFKDVVSSVMPLKRCVCVVRETDTVLDEFLNMFGSTCKVFHLTKENRDEIPQEILSNILS